MSRLRPDICTSLCCAGPLSGDGHCPDCSHAYYKGQGTDNSGKVWVFEHSKQFGPLFTNKNGTVKKFQPVEENHPAWIAFDKWHEIVNGKIQ